MSALELKVIAIEEPADGVRTLRLVPASGGVALAPFAPGAHVEVRCGEYTNAYSLIGDPRRTDEYAISVLRVPQSRGGSAYLHEQVAPGDVLSVGLPRSQFAPPAAARHHLLVAAGIGVTPFLSYASAFAETGASYELHYVHGEASSPHAAIGELPPERVRVHVGRRALWQALQARLQDAPLGTHLSVCGPAEMIDEVLGAAREAGWPEHRLHSERFAGVAAPAGAPFTAVLAQSGRRIEVGAEESLLDALTGAGVPVASLCRQGVCGECRLAVRGGELEHHDLYLSPAERDAGATIMACVSRCAGGELELEL